MSATPSQLILVCPTCGRKYSGDPAQPDAAYHCPDDRARLVRDDTFGKTIQESAPPSPDSEKTLIINDGDSDKTLISQTTSDDRRSVLAILHSTDDRQSAAFSLHQEKSQDKYEVVGELGKGGVGQVLKVRDRDLKREVAMKLLLPSAADGSGTQTQDVVNRFIEEAQATGQLEHPNIVPVHDLGVDGEGRVYFTLKYVQGVSLKQVIRGRNNNTVTDDRKTSFREAYSPLRMIEILISMCQAVAYAHSKGIIHRDLKPDNVMLGKFGEILVMDWGLAKVIANNADSMDGSIAGTPAYMAPEQAAGRVSELDERTDIYALGAILYEILTGEPPYRGKSGLDLVRQVVAGPPSPVKKQRAAAGFSPMPRELAAICERAMARKSQDRYASAAALRNDLQAYLESLPVSACRDTRLQLLGKWIKRNRRQVQSGALSAAAVLLIVFGGWFGWFEWRMFHFVGDGQERLNSARTLYKYKAPPASASSSDPYAGQMNRAMWEQRATLFRAALQSAMEPLRKALDLSPNNRQARSLMAEANMDLWRLAVDEQNTELASVTRREVEAFAPDLSLFSAELNGYGSVIAAFDAPDAEVFLFRFETLNLPAKDGLAQPARLIPVPYSIKEHHSDAAFLQQEQTRIASGKPVPVDKHSIFNLEPTPASRAGSGKQVVIPELPPGGYMLLVRAGGRVETRISLRMDRLARIKQDYVLPKTEDNPPGFFYMAGGDVIVGGETAGAPASHSMKVEPAWIYHDEISMGEYGAFLQSLARSGKAGEAEARQRLPKDFGKNLATLGADGRLLPAEPGADPDAFAKTPVRGVSLNDAQAYIAWRSKQEGFPYRLPREWEWEAACRGADGRKYSWGDTPGKGLAVVTQGYGDNGNSMSWKWEDYEDESPWGIHNLAGGVAEWTASPYDPKAKPEDPVFGQQAIRGNAWSLPPVGLECAFRTSGQPDYFHPTIGFRMALDVPYTRTGAGEPGLPAGHVH